MRCLSSGLGRQAAGRSKAGVLTGSALSRRLGKGLGGGELGGERTSNMRFTTAIAGVSGILFAVLVFAPHRHPPARYTNTVSGLKNLALAVDLCERRFQQPILTLLEARHGDESSTRARLERFLADNSEFLLVPAEFIRTTMFHDGWGHSFEVGLTAEIISTNDPAWSALSKCGIAAWSIGNNGINEFGKGDDMLWRGAWERRRPPRPIIPPKSME